MKTLIIGGGLSGLALADMLEVKGADYLLIEGRDRFGGRIASAHSRADAFDMGPAWFWPGQPRILALIQRLGLARFDQFATGALTFEDEQGHVQQGRGMSSMEGSWRLQGGLSALTQALAEGLPARRKRLNAHVVSLAQTPAGIRVTLSGGSEIRGDQVVFAMPPRLAAGLKFTPELPQAARQTMQDIPTWMAGQAKAVAVYDSPFWRDAGLSGDAMSRRGPMVEIHDASPENGAQFALFGFIGVPPDARRDEAALNAALRAQLGRLFGPEAAAPKQLFVKDWAFDPFTATQADKAPLFAHPTYSLPKALTQVWGGKVQFAGTEVAPQFGGYLEGALEAAENVLATLGR